MTLDDSMTGLRKHGYSLQDVKRWRAEQHRAGKASTLRDFYAAHKLCLECSGAGRKISGVRWQDSNGTEHSAVLSSDIKDATFASLYESKIKNATNWDYTYVPCDACGGTGKMKE